MRERIERELQAKIDKRVVNWSSEAFLFLRLIFFSISFIFPSILLTCNHVTFHLPFLLFYFIFINKMLNSVSFPFQSLCQFFFQFLLSHNTQQMMPTRIFFPTFSLEYMSRDLGLIFLLLTLLHELLSRRSYIRWFNFSYLTGVQD